MTNNLIVETWNRCDVCGQYIPIDDFASGKASRALFTPDSEFTTEEYETLCHKHKDAQ